MEWAKLMIGILLTLFVLAGCTSQSVIKSEVIGSVEISLDIEEPTPSCTDINENSICDIDEVTKEVEISAKSVERALDQNPVEGEYGTLADLLELHKKNVKSYSYIEVGSRRENFYLYWKDNIKVVKYTQALNYDFETFNTIHIDSEAKEIIGVCQDRVFCGGTKQLDLPYHKYNERTILEILKQYGAEKIVRISHAGMMDSGAREVYNAHLSNGMVVVFDKFHNFPMRVEHPTRGVLSNLETISFNSVPQIGNVFNKEELGTGMFFLL